MKLLRRFPELFILTAVALLTRFWGLFYPAKVVFDEVYFKVYAGNYLNGAYYFDPHPPLGKLLLGAWGWIAGIDPQVLVSETAPAVALRILPALAGALIIPVFYLFLRQLGASRKIATLGGILLILENALLVESRFILTDSLLILFGLSTVTVFLAARNQTGRRRTILLAISALLAGLTASTKWTGLAALGIIGVFWLADIIIKRSKQSWGQRFSEAAIMVVVPICIYLSVFWIHFSLLPKTGQGDAFMSPAFQSTLIGNSDYNPSAKLSFLEKFIDLNVAMARSEKSLETATHPYGSHWSSWPIMIRPVYYWQGETLADGRQGNIYLLGNPVIWWGILAVIIGVTIASGRALKRLHPYRYSLIFLAAAYAVNFLPFSRIVRVMFIYHYLFALIFSLAFALILLGAVTGWLKESSKPWAFPSANSRRAYIGIVVAALIGFIYFSPLTYGFPLSPAEIEQHMWLRSWR